jgi:hypothetical protein
MDINVSWQAIYQSGTIETRRYILHLLEDNEIKELCARQASVQIISKVPAGVMDLHIEKGRLPVCSGYTPLMLHILLLAACSVLQTASLQEDCIPFRNAPCYIRDSAGQDSVEEFSFWASLSSSITIFSSFVCAL